MQDEPFVAVALHADHVSGLPAGLELVAPFHVHALEVVLWPLVHGQWLRGQRQEAFVNFLTTWDETIPQFERRVLDTEEIERIDNAGAWDDAHNAVLEALEEYYRRPLQQAAERVQMLGPEAVEQAVNAMLDTVTNMAEESCCRISPPGKTTCEPIGTPWARSKPSGPSSWQLLATHSARLPTLHEADTARPEPCGRCPSPLHDPPSWGYISGGRQSRGLCSPPQ